MKPKKIILEELNRIKFLFDYKKGVVISEQEIKEDPNTPVKPTVVGIEKKLDPTNGGYIKIMANFLGGKSSTDDVINKNDFETGINDAVKFFTENQGKFIIKVKIRAGESVVPGFPMGQLSGLRKESIKKYINSKIPKGSKLPKFLFRIEQPKTQAPMNAEGKEIWDEWRKWKKLADDKKLEIDKERAKQKLVKFSDLTAGYIKDQFNEIIIYFQPDLGESQCLFNAKIWVNYDESRGHSCDHARFKIFANGVQLQSQGVSNSPTGQKVTTDTSVAILNNGGYSGDPFPNNSGGFRYNQFILKDVNVIKKIVEGSKDNKISITYECDSKKDGRPYCHKDAFHVIVYDDDGRKTADTWSSGGFGDLKGEAAMLDSCLKLIGPRKEGAMSQDSKQVLNPAGTPATNFTFPKLSGMNNQQYIENLLTDWDGTGAPLSVVDEKTNTFQFTRNFNVVIDGKTVQYKAGDRIILPKNSNVKIKSSDYTPEPKTNTTQGKTPPVERKVMSIDKKF